MVAVRAGADADERLAAVGGPERARVQHVDDVLVARVGEHVRVVERALADVAPLVDQLPRRAGIVRAEEAAVLVLDERVDAVRIGAGDGDADLADHARTAGPALRVISRHVSPPSVDLKRPLPGPPLDIWYSTRYASHSAAYITLGIRAIDARRRPRRSCRRWNSFRCQRLAAVDALEEAALVAGPAVACRSRRRRRCRDSSDGCGSSRSRRSCRSRRASTSCRRRPTCRRRRRA